LLFSEFLLRSNLVIFLLSEELVYRSVFVFKDGDQIFESLLLLEVGEELGVQFLSSLDLGV
jgi:hypothetical protein